MGVLRACFCCLFLTAASLAIGACSSDDGGSSSSLCHCEWPEGSCYESEGSDCDCARETCTAGSGTDDDGCTTIHGEEAGGACSQDDVIGSCFCDQDNLYIYYRSTFSDDFSGDDPQADCENYYFDCIYTAR